MNTKASIKPTLRSLVLAAAYFDRGLHEQAARHLLTASTQPGDLKKIAAALKDAPAKVQAKSVKLTAAAAWPFAVTASTGKKRVRADAGDPPKAKGDQCDDNVGGELRVDPKVGKSLREVQEAAFGDELSDMGLLDDEFDLDADSLDDDMLDEVVGAAEDDEDGKDVDAASDDNEDDEDDEGDDKEEKAAVAARFQRAAANVRAAAQLAAKRRK